jgi:DNA-binding LacI/PurR family transcriptional regulator
MSGVTISDLANACGVSKATVSRVLNHPGLVSEPLRDRVLKAMRELGYTPNPFARQLGIGGSHGMALFVLDILNPFFALIAREINKLAFQSGMPLTICDSDYNEDMEMAYLDHVIQNRIGGIIFTEGISQTVIDRAKGRVPVVLIDLHSEDGGVAEVTSDSFGGALAATEYLIQLEHRRIAFVTGPLDWATALERFRGYQAALEKYGIPLDSELVHHGDFRPESGMEAIDAFFSLSEWPTAVFCSNDQMVFGALNKAQNLNLSVPEDFSLIGFDDIPLVSLVRPKVTTVHQDVPAICRKALELLNEQISGTMPSDRVVVPTRFMARDSCRKNGPRSTMRPLTRQGVEGIG